MTLPSREAGVAAGEPGYDEYVVVHVEDSRVTVSVTTVGSAAGGTVTPPYAAVYVIDAAASEAVSEEAVAADAAALRLAPTANAALLKFVKELGAPSRPQLTAKTIP